MNARRFWISCFFGLASCGGSHKPGGAPGTESSEAADTPPASAAPSEGGRPDFDALLAREAKGLTKQKFKGPQGHWTVSVDAAGAPKVTASESIGIAEIPIGSDVAVRCEVLAEDIDPAASVASILANFAKKVTFKQITPWDVRVVKEAPAMYVRALYLMPTPKGQALGHLKIAIHAAPGHPVLCVHDELGYEKTFLDLTASFFESIDHAGAKEEPSVLLEIQTAKIEETFVGFAKLRVVKNGANRELRETSSLMLPASPTDLHLVDDFTSQTVDKNGRLVKGVWVESLGGKIGMNLHLERTKNGSYDYSGEVQGKPVKGTLKAKTPAGLATTLSSAKLLASEVKKPNGFAVTESGYYPGIDPTQAFDVRYHREKGEPPGTTHLQAGTLKFVGTIDRQGLFERVQIPIGANTLKLERQLIREASDDLRHHRRS